MTTKPLDLPPDLAAKLEDRVASGAAADAVEVVRDGLALLEAEDARRLAVIRDKLAMAMAEPGPGASADEVFARVHAVLDSLPNP